MKKSKKTISLILFFISIFFLFYTFYESEIKYKGSEHSYYFKLYLICFVLIFYSITTFYLKNKTNINILIIFISSFFALYLVNAFLLVKGNMANFDTRTKLQIYLDLQEVEKNITMMMYPQTHGGNEDYPLFSLSSISNKKTIHCNENGYFSIHKTDRYGFNNPDLVWEKNKIEFLLIGDSFTHGACVNRQDTISGNLKKIIRNDEVLNLGHGLNGPLTEYATIREYLPLKKTKRVVWIYAETNDLNDLKNELKDKTLLNYINDNAFTQKLYTKQNEIDDKLEKAFNKTLQDELTRTSRGKIISFLRLYKLRNFINIQFDKPANIKISNKTLENFSKIIYLSKDLSNIHGAKFYFVYLPDYFRYKYKSYQNSKFKKYGDIIKIVNKLNIPIIDLNKDLMEMYPDPLSLFPFRSNNHYNELGYKLIAETIQKKIMEYEVTKNLN